MNQLIFIYKLVYKQYIIQRVDAPLNQDFSLPLPLVIYSIRLYMTPFLVYVYVHTSIHKIRQIYR